jgi:hypothetical protein
MLTIADAKLDIRTAFLEDDVRYPMGMKDLIRKGSDMVKNLLPFR